MQPAVVPPGVVPAFTNHATDLASLLAFDQQSVPEAEVPLVVTKCCTRLYEQGLATEGIFRVPGNSNRLMKCENEFNLGRGASVDFRKMGISVEDAASLLKKFLRESLNDTLFPSTMQSEFANLGNIQETPARNAAFLALWERVPAINRAVLKQLLELLVNVAANSGLNLMNFDNLGTVFGGMADIPMRGGKPILLYMLEEHDALFGREQCLNAKSLVFRRKMINHNKSIFCLTAVEDKYVISADGQGAVSVWNAQDYSIIKKMTCSEPTYVPQLFVNIESAQIQQFWTLFPHYIRIWDIATILAPNTKKLDESPSHTIQLRNACFAALVGESMWISGDKVVIVDAITHTVTKELSEYESAVPGSPVPVLGFALGYIWIWSGRVLHVWQPETYTKVREITIDGFSAPKSCKIFACEGNVWLTTDSGSFIIVDVEKFEIRQVVSGHSAAVYDIEQVGELAWSCSWDKTICWWKTSPSVELLYRMPNKHTDAVSYLLPVWREELNGWDVWSASWDRSCQVTFVPRDYALNIPAESSPLRSPSSSIGGTPISTPLGTPNLSHIRAVSAAALLPSGASAPSSPLISPSPSTTSVLPPPTLLTAPIASQSGPISPVSPGRPTSPQGFQSAFGPTGGSGAAPTAGWGRVQAAGALGARTGSPIVFEPLTLAQMESQVRELEVKLAQLSLANDRELDNRLAQWTTPTDSAVAAELKNFIKTSNESEVEVQLKIEELRLRIRGELHAHRYALINSRLGSNL